MKVLFLNLMFAPSVGFLCFYLVPPGERSVFALVYIFLSFFIVLVYSRFISLSNRGKIFTWNLFPYFLILYGLIYSYLPRWEIQPHGMIDAPVLWMGKSTHLVERFFHGMEFLPNNPDWKFPNYPIGIPIIFAIPSVVIGTSSSLIPQFFTVLMSMCFLGLCFHLANSIHDKKSNILYWVFVASVIFNIKFISVQSDLCADYPISIGLALLVYAFLGKKNKFDQSVFIGIILGFLLTLKNEMLIVVSIYIFLIFAINLLFKRSFYNPRLILIHLVLVAFPITLNRFLMPVVPSDFSFTFLSSPDAFQILINRTFKILTSFFNYYIMEQRGLEIILTFLLLFIGSRRINFILLSFWMIVFSYNFLFLFTRLNIEEHLSDAYIRIAFQLYLILPMALLCKWNSLYYLAIRVLKNRVLYLKKNFLR